MNRAQASLVLALALFCALAPKSGLASGPYGGSVNSIVLADDGATPAWVATERGLFRYRFGRWARVEALAQRDLRGVLESDGALLVVEAQRGLLRSEDDGETWGEAATGLRGRYGHKPDDLRALVGSQENPGHLYLGAAGYGPFASRDGARTWRLLFEGLEEQPPPALYPAALLPPAADRPLIMGTEGQGLFAWTRGAWRSFGDGLPGGLRVQSLAASPQDPLHLAMATRGQGLWESRDGGRTWKVLRRGAYGVVGAVSISARGGVLAHFPEEGLVICREGKAQRPAGLAEAQVRVLVARSAGGWFAGLAHDGVLELSDEGKPGVFCNEGLDATEVLSLAAGSAPGSLWAGDRNGAFYSGNEGATWGARDVGLLGAPASALLWSKDRLYLGSGGQGVYRWAEGSQSWEPRSGGLGTANTIFSFQRDAADKALFVGTEGGILVSHDEGGLWERRNEGLPSASVWLVEADPGTPGGLWAAGAGRVFRLENDGASWAPVVPASPTALLAREGGGLWVLEERRLSLLSAGELQALFDAPPGERLLCLAADGETLWIGSSGGLWAFSQGAARNVWSEAGILSIHVSSNGHLIAGTDGRGALRFRVR